MIVSCQLFQVNGPNLIQPVALNFQSEKTIARLFKLGINLAAVAIVVSLFECAFGSLFGGTSTAKRRRIVAGCVKGYAICYVQ